MEEIWKDIPGYEGLYQASNLGRIKSLLFNKEKILKAWVQNTGYLTVSLNNKKFSLHRLIAKTFIENPNNYPIINHKDGNKLNNKVENLEWCTYKHNLNEAIKLGLIHIKYASKDNKIRAKKIAQYTLDGVYIKTFIGSVDAEKELKQKGIKVNASNIRNVCNGKRNNAGGYKWCYVEE